MKDRWQIYNKIEKSSAFVKAELPLKILKYLIASEEKDMTPSSSEIAYDVLGDSGDIYKDRVAFIRVQVHNLRKKLNLYYLSEGKEDEIKITIPKGSYQIKFEDAQSAQKDKAFTSASTSSLLLTRLLLGTTVLLLGIIGYLLIVWQKPPSSTFSPLISSLASQDSPLIIAVGNRNFYREYDTTLERNRYILDTDNRLPHDQRIFWTLKVNHPEKELSPIPFDKMTYVKYDHFSFANKISAHLSYLNKSYMLKPSSEITELKSNIIYINDTENGNLHYLLKFFNNGRLEFNKASDTTVIGKRIESFVLNDSTKIDLTANKGKDAKRYFIIKKITSYDGFSVLYLISNHLFAQRYIYNQFTTPNFNKELEEQLGTLDAPFFDVLIEINKTERTHKFVYVSTKNE